jgi:hypothetical protein
MMMRKGPSQLKEILITNTSNQQATNFNSSTNGLIQQRQLQQIL